MILAGMSSARHAPAALAFGFALAVGCSTRLPPQSEPGGRPAPPASTALVVSESSGGVGDAAVADAGTEAEPDTGGRDVRPARMDSAVPEAERPACRDALGGQLARVSCNGLRILVAGHLQAPPGRPLPPRATQKMLDAVVELMRRHPELQLLRIEVYSARDPGGSVRRERREIDASQARADAVFRYLWRHGKISPERLDAVGYGFRPAFRRAGQRWPIVLSVVQRAR